MQGRPYMYLRYAKGKGMYCSFCQTGTRSLPHLKCAISTQISLATTVHQDKQCVIPFKRLYGTYSVHVHVHVVANWLFVSQTEAIVPEYHK